MERSILKGGRDRVEPCPYVFVNMDGTVRELHAKERAYLETPFQPGDGARPYVKNSYSQKDGWGEIKGFLERSKVPRDTPIDAAPAENPLKPLTKQDQMQFLRDKGIDVVENADGTFTARKR